MVAALIASKLAELQYFRVVLCGGLAVDIVGRPEKFFEDNSNIGPIDIIPGGCARNVLECLHKLGVKDSLLLSAVGKDSFGKVLLEWMADNGLTKEGVYESKEDRTGKYMCIMQEEEKANGVSDKDILVKIPFEHFKRFEEELKQAKVIALDGNLSVEALDYLCEISKTAIVTFDPISLEKGMKLLERDLLSRITLLKGNRKQMRKIATKILGGKIEEIDDKSVVKVMFEHAKAKSKEKSRLKYVILTSGDCVTCGFIDAATGTVQFLEKNVEKVDKVVKVGGAGDALLGGVIYGFLEGYGIEKGIELGMKCAKMSVVSTFNIHPELSLAKLQ